MREEEDEEDEEEEKKKKAAGSAETATNPGRMRDRSEVLLQVYYGYYSSFTGRERDSRVYTPPRKAERGFEQLVAAVGRGRGGRGKCENGRRRK